MLFSFATFPRGCDPLAILRSTDRIPVGRATRTSRCRLSILHVLATPNRLATPGRSDRQRSNLGRVLLVPLRYERLTVQRRNRKRWFLKSQGFNYLSEIWRQGAPTAVVFTFAARQSDQTIKPYLRYCISHRCAVRYGIPASRTTCVRIFRARYAAEGFGIALTQSSVQTQTAMLGDSFRQEAFRSLRNTPHIAQNFTQNIVQIDMFAILENFLLASTKRQPESTTS
jgi:hypothetical protein